MKNEREEVEEKKREGSTKLELRLDEVLEPTSRVVLDNRQ